MPNLPLPYTLSPMVNATGMSKNIICLLVKIFKNAPLGSDEVWTGRDYSKDYEDNSTMTLSSIIMY